MIRLLSLGGDRRSSRWRAPFVFSEFVLRKVDFGGMRFPVVPQPQETVRLFQSVKEDSLFALPVAAGIDEHDLVVGFAMTIIKSD